MNPIGLILLAVAAQGGKSASPALSSSLQLDSVLDTLHSTVSTLEKVNQITQLGFSAPKSSSLPAPVTPDISVVDEMPDNNGPSPASLLGNIDLQSAMQTLGPIISMLSNNQNSK